MASEVYVLQRIRPREAWWQLSEDERKSYMDKVRKAREGIVLKRLALFSVGVSESIVVNVWPDMESYHKNRMAMGPLGLNAGRYLDIEETLGCERAAGSSLDHYSRQDDLSLV